MKLRNKNPMLKGLITDLAAKSMKGIKIWGRVAECLNRPSRKAYKVNLYQLEKHAKKNDKIIVPGIVLSTGELSKPVEVAALKFSGKAADKIKKAGGKTLSIRELAEKYPDGRNVRIMG